MTRTLFALTLTVGFTPVAVAADYPPPEKLPAHPGFPDPLVLRDGSRVATEAEWEKTARPERKALFEHYMYGQYPTVKSAVSAKLLFEDKSAFDGTTTLREYAVTMAEGTTPVHVLLAVPNGRPGPAPTFVGLNFTGNHTLTDHPEVRIPTEWMRNKGEAVVDHKATEAGRGTSTRWPLAAITARGYAVATAYYGEIVPDDANVDGGLKAVLMPKAEGGRAVDATGAIMAWAWGLHRMVDHLTTVPEIAPKRIAVVGHSRLGKTALLAAAFDDRIAVAFPSQSGTGGAAPSRSDNPNAETVKRITTSFPHWFAPNFSRFADDTSRLPFDQHELVGLVAPRPVLFTCATGDQWANPPGQFEVLKAAAPVYDLLGVGGLKAAEYPAENTLIDSRLGFWVRPGKHDMSPAEWRTYMAFADKWLR